MVCSSRRNWNSRRQHQRCTQHGRGSGRRRQRRARQFGHDRGRHDWSARRDRAAGGGRCRGHPPHAQDPRAARDHGHLQPGLQQQRLGDLPCVGISMGHPKMAGFLACSASVQHNKQAGISAAWRDRMLRCKMALLGFGGHEEPPLGKQLARAIQKYIRKQSVAPADWLRC